MAKMQLHLKRLHDDGDTTLGALYIDGIFECFVVEDQQQTQKVYGETRIPEGLYDVSLRKEGRFHTRYSKKFPDIHVGMLCIHNAPDWKIINGGITFQYVLIHIGNTDDHTAGCLLTNEAVNCRTMTGSGSTNAYKKMYPIVAKHLVEGGKAEILITDIEHGV